MSESKQSRLTVQDIPARGLDKCRLQLREYRREQSTALCQRHLSHVLLVPSCPHQETSFLSLWLACVSELDESVSGRRASNTLCQPKPLAIAALTRTEILSGCSTSFLGKLKDSMRPKLLPHASFPGHTADGLLQRLPVCVKPPELDVPVMGVDSRQDISLRTRQAFAAAAEVPDEPRQRREALDQFLRESGIHPQKLPLPDLTRHVVPDSHQDELQPPWDRANGAVLLLEPPLSVPHKQQGRAAHGLPQTETLLHALSGSCSAAALPDEEEQTSLAQRWSADDLMKQSFATQLMHEPLQPLLGKEHKSLCQVVQAAQLGPCELPQALTCPRPDGRAVHASVLGSMMQPLPLPEAAGEDVAWGLTFHDLVAPGQVLCGEYPGLPLVQVKDRSADSLQVALYGPASLAQTLRVKPISLAAAELLLDWSLKDPAAPDPSKRIQQVRERMKQALTPRLLQQPEPLPPLVYWLDLIQQLTGPPAPQRGCLQSPEQLHAMVQRISKHYSSQILSRQELLPPPACSKAPAKSGSELQPLGGRNPASDGAHGKAARAGVNSQTRAQERAIRPPEGEANRGVFLRARKRARGAPQQQGQDAAFFMGLQRGAGEGGSEVSGSSDDSLADGFHGEPEVEHKLISMPFTHASMLSLIHTTCQDILCSTPGANREVAPPDPSDTAALEKAIISAAELESRVPGSQRMLLKAYSGVGVLRQSGHLLLCYGVRCAHLHLKHCMQELPGLYASCREVAAGLQHAYDEVEAGRLQDHPKLAALKAVLTTVSAIQPGGKVLLIAESRAYFTVYRTITDTGMRVYQLDRDGGHSSKTASREDGGVEFKSSVEAALQHADCILATEEHVSIPGFPLSSFCCLVRYVYGSFHDSPRLQAVLQEAPCARIVLFEVDRTNLFIKQRPEAPVDLGTAAPPGNGLIPALFVHGSGNRALPGNGYGTTGSGHDRQPAAAFRPATSAKHHTAQPAATVEEAPASWSLALTTRKDSPVRMRRPLYEALLRLEAEGAAVVDRQLRAEDVALSAGACCCIWTEDSLKGSDAASLLRERLRAQLVQVGAAYSTCLLCLEGSPAFELSVMSSVDELIALTRRCGLALSIITAKSPVELERALVTAIREYCKRSQGFPRGPLAEAPSSRAAFLEAFPCLNPFSAATLSGLPCTLQQLLHKPLAELRLAAPEVPERSLSLFLRQAAWGQPVRGVHAAGWAPPDLPDPLLLEESRHGIADMGPHLQQQQASETRPAQRITMPLQSWPHLAREQTSVHSDSSEWVQDGIADEASNLEVPRNGQHAVHADWDEYLDNDLHGRHSTTHVAGQRQLSSQQPPWAGPSCQHRHPQGAPPDATMWQTAAQQHARSGVPPHLPNQLPAHLPQHLPDDLAFPAHARMHEPDPALPAMMGQPQPSWGHAAQAEPAYEPAWGPNRSQEPYRIYAVQQHQGPIEAYPTDPRPLQHPQGHSSQQGFPGRHQEGFHLGHAMGHSENAHGAGHHPNASNQGEPWQTPAWRQPGGSAHPAYGAGQGIPEAHQDAPHYMGRRQHASMQVMQADGMPRSAGVPAEEATGQHSGYPPGIDEFGVSFDPSLDLGSPADEELLQGPPSGAYNPMHAPLRQGRGVPMQSAPSDQGFHAGTVLDRFLQKRARGPVSHRKRPAPSPDRSQQGLKRAPRRPAFSMIPHGAHAGAAESGDASDEGETVMLNPRESPALNTPFRQPKYLGFGTPTRGQSKLIWKKSRRAL